jgi:hypothetical protein
MLLFNFPGATVLSGFLPVAFFPTEILRQDHLAHPQGRSPYDIPQRSPFSPGSIGLQSRVASYTCRLENTVYLHSCDIIDLYLYSTIYLYLRIIVNL